MHALTIIFTILSIASYFISWTHRSVGYVVTVEIVRCLRVAKSWPFNTVKIGKNRGFRVTPWVSARWVQ